MTTIRDSLPARPLSTAEVKALEAQHDEYGVAPVGFFPDLDIVTAFVVIVEGERGYSLGFDRPGEQWVLVEQFEDGDDFAGVTDRLREWMGDDWDDVDEGTVELDDVV
ncbi:MULTISPECIES: hypothetical protein [Haloarcula]|uniref:DUF7964 domain-containing protein n=1 Tax=Haloarcula pellucida TaxID=1427151 RepID=A0A830GJ28_9EURY|nr:MULTISPECIES: hypothetical protein [Halomicroarcula]MBX0347622.1 hypothetical protein [Halomicroarcula pellucida]MDS0276457.1 hypothetical protein [Halomicroarcula sp. S1AR25-4]GGN89620.1 hypothetical protein GCM10009030_10500 [Halomicroarcula pellucida]